MSHELRTPLNSSLILSKLLADNKDGNLSAEQVKYAQTIYGAGNDLLTLINDILDLAKIESGRLDIRPVNVSLSSIVDSMHTMFEPIATEKQLKLRTELLSTTQQIVTDSMRLDQILKNLLSNACKFTEQGEVVLVIQDAANDSLEFQVRDSGIVHSARTARSHLRSLSTGRWNHQSEIRRDRTRLIDLARTSQATGRKHYFTKQRRAGEYLQPVSASHARCSRFDLSILHAGQPVGHRPPVRTRFTSDSFHEFTRRNDSAKLFSSSE